MFRGIGSPGVLNVKRIATMARAIPCHVGFWGREAGLVICRNIPDYQFKTMGTRTSRLVSNLDRGRRERRYSQAPLPLLGETNVLLLNHPAESQATRFSSRPQGIHRIE